MISSILSRHNSRVHKPKRPRFIMPTGPQFLVLSTEQAVEQLERLTHGHGTLFESFTDPQRTTNIRELITALAFQRESKEQTVFTILEILHDEYGDWLEASMPTDRRNDLMDVLTNFSYSIQQQLMAMRAYQNGYLYYHFFDWAGRDLVLRRMDHLPEL